MQQSDELLSHQACITKQPGNENADELTMYEKDEEFHRPWQISAFPTDYGKSRKLQMDRVRHLSLAVQSMFLKHRWIFQNIADGNEDRAENAMKKHLEYFHHDLKIVQHEHPEYFKNRIHTISKGWRL